MKWNLCWCMMSKRNVVRAIGIASCLAILSCGRDRELEEEPIVGSPIGQAVTVEIPVSAQWVPTGIEMGLGVRAEITVPADQRPLGDVKVSNRASLPTYGLHGVIGRIGESGVPFVIGTRYVVQGSSLTAGEQLFLGRNLAPEDPFADLVTAAEEGTDTTEIIRPSYEPSDYVANVQTYATNSPTLLTPIDGFYSNSPNPVFDWDDQNNSAQYSLDISRYRDFRNILFNTTVGTTSLNSAILGIDPTNPVNTGNTPNLTEGLYYWRVRGQINTGRTLQPNLEWTERSVVYRLGVELEQSLPAPVVITPSGSVDLSSGQFLTLEFLAQPDASGLVWRYALYSDSCQATINPDESIAAKRSVWQAFQSEYESNDVSQVPSLYGVLRTGSLSEGAWLVRVETRDGKDRDESRVGGVNYRFTVGCQ